MLKRLWFLLSALWAACCLVPQAMSADGLRQKDFFIAAMPFIAGFAVLQGLRFVLGGRRSQRIYPR